MDVKKIRTYIYKKRSLFWYFLTKQNKTIIFFENTSQNPGLLACPQQEMRDNIFSSKLLLQMRKSSFDHGSRRLTQTQLVKIIKFYGNQLDVSFF